MGKKHRSRINQETQASRRRLLKAIGLGTVGVAVVGGGGLLAVTSRSATTPNGAKPLIDFSPRFAAFEPALAPNGDLAMVVWPSFVTAAGPEVKRLYEFNIQNGELMR